MRNWMLVAAIILVHPVAASAASIPLGAQRVPLLQFTLTAACEDDALIDTILVHHTGLGDVSDINHVYLMQGRQRISAARTFSRKSQTAELRLRGLRIPACTERIFSVAADFSAQAAAGSEHGIAIERVTTQTGAVSVSTGTGFTADAQITPGETGLISVAYRELHGPVRYGSSRTIARIAFSADDTTDQAITVITLTNNGKARDADLRNIRLYDGVVLLAPAVDKMDDNRIRFALDPPLAIGRNQTKLLTVKADVRASVRKTIQLQVDESSDIEMRKINRSFWR